MEVLISLGIAVGIMALIVVAACFAYSLSEWLSHKSLWTTRMKFKQWLDLYYLNPEDWCLEDTPNRYVTGNIHRMGYWAYIHFSFSDYLHYQAWRRGNKRRAEDMKRDKRLKDVLELAQSDIERLKRQADGEMEEAKRQVEETSHRVNNPITRPPYIGLLGRTNCNGTAPDF